MSKIPPHVFYNEIEVEEEFDARGVPTVREFLREVAGDRGVNRDGLMAIDLETVGDYGYPEARAALLAELGPRIYVRHEW